LGALSDIEVVQLSVWNRNVEIKMTGGCLFGKERAHQRFYSLGRGEAFHIPEPSQLSRLVLKTAFHIATQASCILKLDSQLPLDDGHDISLLVDAEIQMVLFEIKGLNDSHAFQNREHNRCSHHRPDLTTRVGSHGMHQEVIFWIKFLAFFLNHPCRHRIG
jgi:hypothetical protein